VLPIIHGIIDRRILVNSRIDQTFAGRFGRPRGTVEFDSRF
jgi:hypothetical protein